jgi:transposase-like protein
MKSKNTRIASLKEMMALEENRTVLKKQIEAIDLRLSSIQNELYGPAARRTAAKEEKKTQQKFQLKRGRKGRGELLNDILEILQVAGRAGVTVKELAKRIGVKPANIHSWFSTNLKKIAALKKVGEARYALVGKLEANVKKAKFSKKAASDTAKPAKKTRKNKAARGALKEQIIAELTQAGSQGVTIKDLAEKLKTNYRNLYVWFVTTGKRIPGITKVGPAQYKLEAAA